MLFHRTGLTAALPEPETGGTLGELWAMLNVAPDDHPLDTSRPTGTSRIRCDLAERYDMSVFLVNH